MGAGHDGAARELARRLDGAGHPTQVRDFLDAGPLRIGSALRGGYQFELRHLPSAYDATYRFWHRVPWLAPVVAWLVTALTRRRLMRWVRSHDADVVVSTYPLATLCLGRLRAGGRLGIPAINFITDFGVHPLWVHRGIDLNLAVHTGPAELAWGRTGKPSIACGPLVADRFDPAVAATPERRAEARSRLGLGPDDMAVLIVAGSWGVGSLRQTFQSVAACSGVVPVVICGRDADLTHHVRRLADGADARSVILGWTDEMPTLMAASDALVENAGGLTAFEAMRIGLPVVSYRPIAGHGKENTAAMAAAGVSRLAADPYQLAHILDDLRPYHTSRQVQVRTARAMFVTDGARRVLDAVPATRAPALRRGRKPRVVLARATTALVTAAVLTWGGLTTGVGVAAAMGTGVAHAVPGSGRIVYVGARLSGAQLSDPAVARQLAAIGASAVVDDQVASANPIGARALAESGVDVENGGEGHRLDQRGHRIEPSLWNRAKNDVNAANQLSQILGRPATVFVPGRRVNAFDMMDTGRARDRLVVPNQVIDVGDQEPAPGTLASQQILLVNGLGGTPAQMRAALSGLASQLSAANLGVEPLAALR